VKIAAAITQFWPGIRIQVIAIVQPPGIGIEPDIIRAEASVNAAAIRKIPIAPAYNRCSTVDAPCAVVDTEFRSAVKLSFSIAAD